LLVKWNSIRGRMRRAPAGGKGSRQPFEKTYKIETDQGSVTEM